MNTQQMIDAAIKGTNPAEGTHPVHRSTRMTSEGEIICTVTNSGSRTSFSSWSRVDFFIVKKGQKFRSRISKAKVIEMIG